MYAPDCTTGSNRFPNGKIAGKSRREVAVIARVSDLPPVTGTAPIQTPRVCKSMSQRPRAWWASCAVQDMGQGARSVIAKAIADELGRTCIAGAGTDWALGLRSRAYCHWQPNDTVDISGVHRSGADDPRESWFAAATRELQLRDATWHEGGVRHATGHIPLHELTGKISAQSVTSNKRGSNGAFDILGKLPQGELGESASSRR